MAFRDARLPENIERGATGGPGFSTTVLERKSGHENRNVNWSQTRARYDIGYGLMKKGAGSTRDFSTVLAFFYAMKGKGYSFRFKDWSDFELDRQKIGETDGATATFQAYKRYSAGAYNHDRTLTKIVSGSYSVWVDNVLITEGVGGSQFSINLLTGVVTLGGTLAAQTGTDIDFECEFDTPVRFDIDDFKVAMTTYEAGSIPTIPLIEVKVD